MFEKEAEEYGNEYWDCLVDSDDRGMLQEAFKDGAEFGYNKANEWHYPYTKILGLILGEFCEGYNNLWTSNRCDFTTEEIIAWIEKEKILPKESE